MKLGADLRNFLETSPEAVRKTKELFVQNTLTNPNSPGALEVGSVHHALAVEREWPSRLFADGVFPRGTDVTVDIIRDDDMRRALGIQKANGWPVDPVMAEYYPDEESD